MQSPFWDFLFNQVYLSKQAQFNSTDQVEVGKPCVIEEIIRTFLTIQKKTDGEHVRVIREQIEKSLIQIENRTDIEIATLFSLVPESHTPLISTGKRCRDDESGDEFICLGFSNASSQHIYETRLSMVAVRSTQVIGLVLNKGSQQTQIQKAYDLMHVQPITNIDASDIAGKVSADELKRLNKTMTQNSSIYMNPEIITKLLGRTFAKESLVRQNPQTVITQQFLQTYVQNGILEML